MANFAKGMNMAHFLRFRPVIGQLIAIFLIVIPISASQVQANTCLAFDKLNELIEKRYFERPFAEGLVDENFMVQLFKSEKGTWTLAIINTDGVACIVASGTHWEKSVLPSGPGA